MITFVDIFVNIIAKRIVELCVAIVRRTPRRANVRRYKNWLVLIPSTFANWRVVYFDSAQIERFVSMSVPVLTVDLVD